MEEHRIKVIIANRTYRWTMSEHDEEVIRKAAQSVNAKIASLSKRYPQISPIDILTIVALNESIEGVELQARLSSADAGYERLDADLKNYVDSLK